MTTTSGVAEAEWVFACGQQRVRIARVAHDDGRMQLIIDGLDGVSTVHDFANILGCVTRQASLERELVAAGFHLQQFFPERRRGVDRRGKPRGMDRRGVR
jgi:hypothetical protein